jgi:hypothetical protein
MTSKFLFSLLAIFIAAYQAYTLQPSSQIQKPQPAQQSSVKGAQIATRTKTDNCQINGPLQDIGCTPGAVDSTLTKDILCSSSFTTKSVRNVPSAEKQQVYSEYGIASHQPGQYEVDHLISLELGGSNDIANLWPEPAEPRPGFHEKDIVENTLHKQVCNGSMPLAQAQQEISSNWMQLYQSAK